MPLLNEQIQFPPDSSIILKSKNVPHFTFPYHYHKEYELVYVKEGYGTRYVGGYVEKFTDGDMVLLAPNLPHCWESDKAFYKNTPNLRVRAIVVQIPNDFFKTVISSYPEFVEIKHLLEKSSAGLKICGETRNTAALSLSSLFNVRGIERLFLFLNILSKISKTSDCQRLSQSIKTNQLATNSRMGKVFSYIKNNFEKPIYLDELCLLTGLTSTGFCLWFKRNTGKTFSNFLHEIRIGKACEMLRFSEYAELKIADISFKTGFENLSNFNRVFKKITGLSPKEYKKLFSGHSNF